MSRDVGAFLASARRRIAVVAAFEGAITGLGVAAVLVLFGWPGRGASLTPAAAGILAAIVGAVARAALARRSDAGVAMAVEHRAPQSRNLLFTAVEVSNAPRGYIGGVIAERANALVRTLDAAALFPVGRRAFLLPVAAVVWAGALAIATRGEVLGRVASATPSIDRVDVTVTPPAYTGRRPTTERSPDRIRALAGSRIELRVLSNAVSIGVATADSSRSVPVVNGEAVLTMAPTADGFVTLTATGTVIGDRRTLGIALEPDAAPTVRITAPGRDLFVSDGKRALDVAIEAGDDIGLSTLTLRYTKVSGSGERFTFKDADVPIVLAKTSATSWRASKSWSLNDLALEPGDMVVYRAIATDNRPGSPPIESDAFIVEVTAPGGVAEAGYSVDPEEERTAISQQMVVLKTQRLLAEKAKTAPEAYTNASQEIAAEQRRVRAEFVFLMGGEMSDAGANDSSMTDIDESADAAAEEDLMAGRQLNQGRVALLRAIRAMSFAARSLNEADLTTALTHERDAVKQLELAFSKNRILLRAFSQREALDTTRRLSGEMSDLARGVRQSLVPISAKRAAQLREIVEHVHQGNLDLAAEWVLRFDATSEATREVASLLTSAQSARRAGNDAAARQSIDRAMQRLHTEIYKDLPLERPGQGNAESRQLRGLVNQARRGRVP